MSRTIYFDIETGSLPDNFLDLMVPKFEAPSNYKDEAKIAANIEEQERKWRERAALSPLTGKVLAIGIINETGEFSILHGEGNEASLLAEFKHLMDSNRDAIFCGFNSNTFDLPFMVKRAWAKGVPPCIRPGFKFWGQDRFIDLMEVWCCGDRTERASLDTIARFFGLGGKNGSGADFARLWSTDREQAELYLQRDLFLTKAVAVQMGVD